MKFFLMSVFIGIASAELRFIDLTHTFGNGTIYWPANPPFNFSRAFEVDLPDPKFKIVSNYIQTAEHSGTHMDAPLHFCVNKEAVHQITLDRLSGPGVKLDFEAQAINDYDYEVTVQDIKDWESKNGQIPEGAIVLLKFGWNKFWNNWEKAFNSNDFKNFSSFHWPALSIEAAKFIAGQRKVRAIGADTISADRGQSKTKQNHIELLCNYNVLLIENVGNIDALPITGSRVFIGALKLEHGGGTPIRLFATIDDGNDVSGSSVFTSNVNVIAACISLIVAVMFELF